MTNEFELEIFDGAGEGAELALPGDTIRRRHIATRASNRRRIIVLVLGDSEFEGYAIGLDSETLQILELPSGEVSSISLRHIVAISDGKPFTQLSRDEKDIVDRRTASFKKTCQNWLVKNWPNVYDKRDDEDRPPRARPRYPLYNRSEPGGVNTYVDQEVRDRASQD